MPDSSYESKNEGRQSENACEQVVGAQADGDARPSNDCSTPTCASADIPPQPNRSGERNGTHRRCRQARATKNLPHARYRSNAWRTESLRSPAPRLPEKSGVPKAAHVGVRGSKCDPVCIPDDYCKFLRKSKHQFPEFGKWSRASRGSQPTASGAPFCRTHVTNIRTLGL